MDQQGADVSEPEDGEILDETEETSRASSPEGEYEHRRLNCDKRRSFRRSARGHDGRSRVEQHSLSGSISSRRRSQASGSTGRHGQPVATNSRSRSGGSPRHGYNTRYGGRAKHSRSRGSPSSSRRASGPGSTHLKTSSRRSSKTHLSKSKDKRRQNGKRSSKDHGDGGSCTQLDKASKNKKSHHKKKSDQSRTGSSSYSFRRNSQQTPESSRQDAPSVYDIPLSHDIPSGKKLLLNGSAVQNGFETQAATSCNVETEPVTDDDDDSVQVIPDEEVAAGKKSPLIITLDTTDTSEDEDQKKSEESQQQLSDENGVIISTEITVEASQQQNAERNGEQICGNEDPCDDISAATGDDRNQMTSATSLPSDNEIVIISESNSSTSNDVTVTSRPSDDDQNEAAVELDEDMYELELRNQLLADLVEKTVKQETANANKTAVPNTNEEIEESVEEGETRDDNVDEEENALREVLLSQMANKKRKLVGSEENINSNNPPVPSSSSANHSTLIVISPGSTKSLQDLRSTSNPNSPSSPPGRPICKVRLTNSNSTPSNRRGSNSARGRRGRNNRQRTRHKSDSHSLIPTPSLISPSGTETVHHRTVRIGGIDQCWNPPHLVNRPANIKNLPGNDLRNKLLRNRRNEQQSQEPNTPLSTLFPEFGVADTDMRPDRGLRHLDAASDMTIRRTVNFDSKRSKSATSSSTAITYMAPINIDIPTDQALLPLHSPSHSRQQLEMQHQSLSPYTHQSPSPYALQPPSPYAHQSHSPYAHHSSPLGPTPMHQLSPTGYSPIPNAAVLAPQQQHHGIIPPQMDNPFRCIDPFGFSSPPTNAPPVYSSSGLPFLPNTSLPSSSGLIMSLPGYHGGSLDAEVIVPLDVDHRINRQLGIPLLYQGNGQNIGNASRILGGNMSPLPSYTSINQAAGISSQGSNSVSPVIIRQEHPYTAAPVTTIEQITVPYEQGATEPPSRFEITIERSRSQSPSPYYVPSFKSPNDPCRSPFTPSCLPHECSTTSYDFLGEALGRRVHNTSSMTQPSFSVVSVTVPMSAANMLMSSSGNERPIASASENVVGQHHVEQYSTEKVEAQKSSTTGGGNANTADNNTNSNAISSNVRVSTPIPSTSTSSVTKVSPTTVESEPVQQNKNSQSTLDLTDLSVPGSSGENSVSVPLDATHSVASVSQIIPPSEKQDHNKENTEVRETGPSPSLTTVHNSSSVGSANTSTANGLSSSRSISSRSSDIMTVTCKETITSSTVSLPASIASEPLTSPSVASITGVASPAPQHPATSDVTANPSSLSTDDPVQVDLSPTLSVPVRKENISISPAQLKVSSSSSQQGNQSSEPEASTSTTKSSNSPTSSSSRNSIAPPRPSPPTGRELQVLNSPLLELCSATPLRESTFNQQTKTGSASASPAPDSTTTAGTHRPISNNKRPPIKLSADKSKALKSSPSKLHVQIPVAPKPKSPSEQVVVPSKRPTPKEQASLPSKRPVQKVQDPVPAKKTPVTVLAPVPSNGPPLKEHVQVPPRQPAKPKVQLPLQSKPGNTIMRKSIPPQKAVVPIVVHVADGDTTEDEEDEEGKKKDRGKSEDGNKTRKVAGNDKNGTEIPLTPAASDPSSPAFQNFLDEFLKTMRKNVDKLENERSMGGKKVVGLDNKSTEPVEQLQEETFVTASTENTDTSTATADSVAQSNSDLTNPIEDVTFRKPSRERRTSPVKASKSVLPQLSREASPGNEESKIAASRKRQASPGLQMSAHKKKKINQGQSVQSQGAVAQMSRSSPIPPAVFPVSKPATVSVSNGGIEISVNSKAVIESLTQRVTETRDQIQLSFKEKELLQSRQHCYDEYRNILQDLQQHTRLTNFDTKLGQDIQELEKKLETMKKRRETVQLKAIDLNRTIREKSKAALTQKKVCLTLATEVKKLGDKIIGGTKYKVPNILVENINELVRSMKTMDSKQSQILQRERGVTFKQLILDEGFFSATPSGSKGPAPSAPNNNATTSQVLPAVTAAFTGPSIQTPVNSQQQRPQQSSARLANERGTSSVGSERGSLGGASKNLTDNAQHSGQEGKNGRDDTSKPGPSVVPEEAVEEKMPLFITRCVRDYFEDSEEGKQGKETVTVSEERLPLLAGDVMSAILPVTLGQIDIGNQVDSSVLQTEIGSENSANLMVSECTICAHTLPSAPPAYPTEFVLMQTVSFSIFE